MTEAHRSATGHHQFPFERDLAATAALALYSFTVAIGFARVFSGWSFLVDLAILVLVGHGSSFVLRRAGVNGWAAIPIVVVGLLWTLTISHYPSTLNLVVPGRATWRQLRIDVEVVRDQFQTAVAPVIYEVGWATLAGLAMVIAIVMADAFAFKAEARGEALVPGGVLFVFISALGSPRLRLISTLLVIAAGVVAVAALRTLHDRTRRVELTTSRKRSNHTLIAALATAVIVATIAGLAGPRIPGAGAEPLYETCGRGGITSVNNPLVDIRSRLVNQGNVELFRVNSNVEAYWRSTTLPEFDGRTFRLPSRDLSPVEDVATGAADARQIRQQTQILALDNQFLPAAADAYQVRPNENMRLNSDTNTLLKISEFSPGEQFLVISTAPIVDLDQLRTATTDNPPDPIFLELPDNLPDVVAETAAEVTAGATTDADRMLALQNWFRTFTYSTEVQRGHGSSAIEQFLKIRTGYCEQFAATFAAMARTLGVPSRVAVGFTSGRLGDDGWYTVLGKNSHAWPEVWFDGVGWVPFEPTPQRGIPGAENYTGVGAQQDDSPPSGSAATDRTVPPTPTTVFAPPNPDRQFPEARFPEEPSNAAGSTSSETSSASEDRPVRWLVLLAILAIAGVVAFPAIARRVSRRAAGHHAVPQRVGDAWRRACQAVSRAGVDGSPAMTAHEWAMATARQLPVAARPMASIATVVDQVVHARPDSLDAEAADRYGRECELWAGQVGRIARDSLSTRNRVRRYFADWR